MDILIIKTGALGDVLRTTSILKPLLNKYGNAKIFWLTKKNAYELLKNNQYIEKIFLTDHMNEILNNEMDLVISLDDEENMCKFASKVKTKKLIGAYYDADPDICTYTREGIEWFGMGLLRPEKLGGLKQANILKIQNNKTVQQHLLNMLGLDCLENEIILNIDQEDLDLAEEFANKNKIDDSNLVIGMNTGAGGRWHLKRMDVNLAIALANRLNQLGAKVILLGGPEEKERNNEIKKKVNFEIIDAGSDNTLLEFAAKVSLCNIVITSDSLCLHIAVGLRKKVAAFFGPTSFKEIDLYNRGEKILPDMDCLCCYRRECNKPNICMKNIDLNEIINAVQQLK